MKFPWSKDPEPKIKIRQRERRNGWLKCDCPCECEEPSRWVDNLCIQCFWNNHRNNYKQKTV